MFSGDEIYGSLLFRGFSADLRACPPACRRDRVTGVQDENRQGGPPRSAGSGATEGRGMAILFLPGGAGQRPRPPNFTKKARISVALGLRPCLSAVAFLAGAPQGLGERPTAGLRRVLD